MGVCGSGKSTIGNLLSQRTGWKFYEGDSFHPPENIAKMSQGTPLTDDDRLPWLLALKDLIHRTLPNKKNIIIACSALKSAYRQILQGEHEEIIWIYLQGNYPEILARMKQRQGHFMKEEMLQSQFQILEEPEQALKVNISLPPEAIVDKIVAYLNEVIP